MNKIEKELVDFSKMKEGKYEDRQDYLAALIRAISKAADKDPDGYDELSNAAAEWYDTAIVPFNRKEEIPDFEGGEAEDDDSDTDDEDQAEESEEADDDDDDVDDDDESDDKQPADGDETPATEAPTEDASVEDDNAALEAEAEAENEAVEAAAHKAKGKVKPKPKEKGAATATPKPAPKKGPQRYTTLEKDRFGIFKATKKHEAAMMYEKGATPGEVSAAIGGKHYNVVRELAMQGHRVEKLPGGKVKLTHKDDLDKKPAKGKKKSASEDK